MFAIVICLVYLNHFKLCVLIVWCSEYYVVSNKCNEPTPVLCDLSVRTVVKLCTLAVFALRVSLFY